MKISKFKYQQRTLSEVKRWAILPHSNEQSVADHSFYVTLYTSLICNVLGVCLYTKVRAVDHALMHDMAEVFTGDAPTPYKKLLQNDNVEDEMLDYLGVKNVNKYTGHVGPEADNRELCKAIVKVADLLDAYNWVYMESVKGNRAAAGQKGAIREGVESALQKLGGECKSHVSPKSFEDLQHMIRHMQIDLTSLQKDGYKIPDITKGGK